MVRSLRRKYPDACLVITGCSPGVDDAAWDEDNSVDIILPNPEKQQLTEYLREWENSRLRQNPTRKASADAVFKEGVNAEFPFRTRAMLKVQEGCNVGCTYCIVPAARGPERSRDRREVLEEFRRFVSAGYLETVITGVNICAYRHDDWQINDLIAEMLKIPGNYRIRLSSMEPTPDNCRLLDLLAENPDRICRFLHIPMQHGSDPVLARMGRKYQAGEFADFIREAAKRIPDLHLGTDVIVGFPGETEEYFTESRDLIASLPLANLHIFRFSSRTGTVAADFPDQVAPELVKQRFNELAKVEKKLTADFITSQIGKVLPVITEEEKGPGEYEGWSDNYLRVRVSGNELRENQLVKAEITGQISAGLLAGKVV